jgi:hypothetical protein
MNPDQPNQRKSALRMDAVRPVRWKISGALYIECPTCGYEPLEQGELPRHACPKCHADTWRRRLRPRQQYADAS